MRRIILVVAIGVAILGAQSYSFGQNGRCKSGEPRGVEDNTDRPQLNVDYPRVTEFKLVSRKTTYRMDELISLDLAMMNTSAAHVYFLHLEGNSLTIHIQDEKGSDVKVLAYAISSEFVGPDSYDFLDPGRFTANSYLLLAGCNAEVRSSMGAMLQLARDVTTGKEDFDKGGFKRNLFINRGRACAMVDRPGTYIVTAEMNNTHVVVSPCDPDAKTATGVIRSSPLKISITE